MVDTTAQWALFMNTEDPRGFAVELCTEDTFESAVARAIFGDSAINAEQVGEVGGYMATLRDEGRIDFEDGWLLLREGVPAIVDFLMDQAKDLAEERDLEDGARAAQHKRADESEDRLLKLRDTLRGLLSPHAEAILVATT